MSGPRSRRALLVVTALSLGGVPRLRPLYRGLDAAAALLGRLLGRRYGERVVLRGAAASAGAIVAAVARLASAPGVAAVDVFLNVHGQPAALTLADGQVPVHSLAAALRALGERAGRLRLLYSTACHGAHHAQPLLAAGFRACLGARGVNGTGAVETPLFLALWACGVPVGRAIRVADHPVARRPADALVRLLLRALGEGGGVDSSKLLGGDPGVTIEGPEIEPRGSHDT